MPPHNSMAVTLGHALNHLVLMALQLLGFRVWSHPIQHTHTMNTPPKPLRKVTRRHATTEQHSSHIRTVAFSQPFGLDGPSTAAAAEGEWVLYSAVQTHLHHTLLTQTEETAIHDVQS